MVSTEYSAQSLTKFSPPIRTQDDGQGHLQLSLSFNIGAAAGAWVSETSRVHFIATTTCVSYIVLPSHHYRSFIFELVISLSLRQASA